MSNKYARDKNARALETGVKSCSKCEVEKPLSEFYLGGRYTACKDCARETATASLQKSRLAAMQAVGGVELACGWCGYSDYRALCIDHVNGGGTAHRKEAAVNAHRYYNEIAKDPSGYQILCHNCNYLKRLENNEHRRGS